MEKKTTFIYKHCTKYFILNFNSLNLNIFAIFKRFCIKLYVLSVNDFKPFRISNVDVLAPKYTSSALSLYSNIFSLKFCIILTMKIDFVLNLII